MVGASESERSAAASATLDELLARHLPGVRAFARLQMDPVLRERESCSDVVQSACRVLLEKHGRAEFEIRDEASFRAWLYSSVLHKIKERRRYHLAAKRSPVHEAGACQEQEQLLLEAYHKVLPPSDEAAALETVERLERCFDRLRAEDREVISWRRIVGLSSDETAIRMGRSAAAVRSLLSRALARLAGLLHADKRATGSQ
jgi:RNA polymerase sigma factor (sigma-70 family)